MTEESRFDISSWLLDMGAEIQQFTPHQMRKAGIEKTHVYQILSSWGGWEWVKYGDWIVIDEDEEFDVVTDAELKTYFVEIEE